LYPTSEKSAYISVIEKKYQQKKETHHASAGSGSGSGSSKHANAAASAPIHSTPPIPDRTFTPDQLQLVKQITKTKDLYSLLGLEKGADQQAICSAYRKVCSSLPFLI
jgi:hypothetical protein